METSERWTAAEYQTWLQTGVCPGNEVSTPPHVASWYSSWSEARFLANVRAYALAHGWKFYHTHYSCKSDEGFPDVVCARAGRLVFLELKSATGKPTEAQMQWLGVLAHSVPGVEVDCFWPEDWPKIQEILL
jgi:hypothetical protein